MADTYSSQVYDGARNYIIKMVDRSDGTGLSALKVVDVTTMTPNPGLHMKIKRIRYSIHSGAVLLQWEATSPIDIVYIPENTNILDFSQLYCSGWPNNAGAGATGNILLTTFGFMPNSGFTIDLEIIKGVQLI